MNSVSESLGGKFSVESIEIKFLNRIHMTNIFIEDQQGDTLLYVPELQARIRYLSRRQRIVEIGKLTLTQPEFHLKKDSTGVINLKFITQSLKESKDTNNTPFRVMIHNIEYNNGKFSLEHYIKKNSSNRINFSDLHLNQLNISAKSFKTVGNGINIRVDKMSFIEETGFVMENFESEIIITNNQLHFMNNRIITGQSSLKSETVSLDFNHYGDFQRFAEKVKLNIQMENCDIHSADLAYFIPNIPLMDQELNFSGSVKGKLSNFHGRNILMKFGAKSNLSGKFDISGLPHIEDAFWFVNLSELNLDQDDFELLAEEGLIKNPEILRNIGKLGDINFKGVFTGFVDDFVSYGKFVTDLGMANTDISIIPEGPQSFLFEGKLSTFNFNIGKFAELEDFLGSMDMHVVVKGSFSQDNLFISSLEGSIQHIILNNYDYHGVQLSGVYSKKSFDGNISIDDPNIRLDFLGLLDFSNEIPEFDFSLNIPRANLYALHFTPSDSTANLSLLMTANFKGTTADDFNGFIKLLNSRYISNGEVLEAYDFSLEAHNRPDSSWIVLQTDYLDAQIRGDYEFNMFLPSFKYLQAIFLPSTLKSFPDTTGIYQNNFSFDIHFKDTEKISDFFFPRFKIARDATISGWFHPAVKQVLIEGSSDHFIYRGNVFYEPEFLLASEKTDELVFAFNTEDLSTNDNSVLLTDFSVHANLRKDSLQFQTSWSNNDSIQYRGSIKIISLFSLNENTGTIRSDIHIYPSQIIHKNDNWVLLESFIKIDTNSFSFHNFSLSNQNKILSLDGVISENPEDSLKIKARGLDLKGISLVDHKLKFSGIVNGEARISEIYNNPRLLSEVYFINLMINEVALGDGSFISEWNSSTNSMHIEASISKEYNTPIAISGYYFTEKKSSDLKIEVDSLNLNIFEPFTKAFSNDLRGSISGVIHMDGLMKQPNLNGELDFHNAGIKIDYTNTLYNFNDKVELKDNDFLVQNIRVSDNTGSYAIANGLVSAKDFKSISLKLDFQTNNLLMLNLKEWQNDLFYGSINGSGSVELLGPVRSLKIAIAVKTIGNSKFFLPLDKNYSKQELNYINFVSDTKESEKELRIKPVKKKIQNQGNLEVKINLETTPELETTLFFDPTAGGSLTVRGLGNLSINTGTSGNFNIFGDYTIDQGIFNFKLSHVINKKFEVKSGSKITFTGNTEDATLDIVGIYKIRTSLYNLFYDEAYRRRIPVNCEIYLSGRLDSPDIMFNIDLPTADEDTKSRLKNTINTEEDLSKQFLSLLIINSFLPDPNYAPAGASPIQPNAVGVTTAELLSNQLSNWVSQISNDFDIGFHYRPGDEVTSQEIEVAIATQILNDRVLINSNIDVGGNQYSSTNNTNEIVGYASVEVKVDKSGKVRVKAFTRPNDKMIYEQSINYETGIGIFFREEFNSFGKLIRRYWNNLFHKKKKDPVQDQVSTKSPTAIPKIP